MEKVLNLTQHNATPDQMQAGVVEPEGKAEIRELLTFEELPTDRHVWERACTLARLARVECEKLGAKKVMIGGAPFLMAYLQRALNLHGLDAVFAFSKRVTVEEPQPDGTVKKTQIFKHEGFVELSQPLKRRSPGLAVLNGADEFVNTIGVEFACEECPRASEDCDPDNCNRALGMFETLWEDAREALQDVADTWGLK